MDKQKMMSKSELTEAIYEGQVSNKTIIDLYGDVLERAKSADKLEDICRKLFLRETGELSTYNMSAGKFLSEKAEIKFQEWLAAKQDTQEKA